MIFYGPILMIETMKVLATAFIQPVFKAFLGIISILKVCIEDFGSVTANRFLFKTSSFSFIW